MLVSESFSLPNQPARHVGVSSAILPGDSSLALSSGQNDGRKKESEYIQVVIYIVA